MAEDIIGRELTPKEMTIAMDCVNEGFNFCVGMVLQNAIEIALKKSKTGNVISRKT